MTFDADDRSVMTDTYLIFFVSIRCAVSVTGQFFVVVGLGVY